MADERTREMILKIEEGLKENNIGVWEEDSEEEEIDMEDIDLDWIQTLIDIYWLRSQHSWTSLLWFDVV